MSSVTSAPEIERKYDVESGTALPVLRGFAGESRPEVDQLARYFDTEGGALARRGAALRRREGGHDDGWHVKLPAERGRTEYHAPLADEPPAELLQVIRAIVRDHPLVEIARLRTRRATTILTDDDGVPVIEIADDRCEASDPAAGTVTIWREWEVELLPGAPVEPAESERLLDAVEEQLLAAGAAVSPHGSKLGRALAGSPTAAALRARGAWEGATRAAVAPVLAQLHRLTTALLDLDRAARADEPDAVRRLRTVLRRLRSVLATYRDVLDPAVTGPLRERLREMGALLEPARDAEVRRILAETLLRDATDDPGEPGDRDDAEAAVARAAEIAVLREVVDGAAAEYAAAHAELLSRLDDAAWFHVLDELDELIARPPLASRALRPARRTLRRAVRRQARRAERRIRTAQGDPATGDELHEVRRAVRRVRYLAEQLSRGPDAVFGGRMRQLAASARAVQRALGTYGDAVLLADHLADAGRRARAAGADATAYQRLARSRRDAADAALAGLGKLERDYSRARDAL